MDTLDKYLALMQGHPEMFRNKDESEIVSRWQPSMMIVVAIGGALMQLALDPADATRILVTALSGPVSVGLAPVAVNLKIAGAAKVDLGISVNFMRSKVGQGREMWNEVKGAFQNDPHFKFMEIKDSSVAQDADQSKNENDWNEVV